jgi:flagellar basal-body rod protein FlgB
MLNRLFDAAALRTAHSALTGLSRRQEAIASNIANIDTPNYARKEVSFEDSLRAQISGETGVSGDVGLGRDAHGLDGASTLPRDVVSARNDKNSVGVDEEMTLLVDTQLRYQALSQSLGTRLSTLRTVIRGQ